MAHDFPYDVKLRIMAHSRSFLANQKDRNAIFGAENLLSCVIDGSIVFRSQKLFSLDYLGGCWVSPEVNTKEGSRKHKDLNF